jgi:hypothetical protein
MSIPLITKNNSDTDPQIDFIGIGAVKAATSWIAQCLREHPMVCLFEGKEANVFNDDVRYANARSWYQDQYDSCKPDQLRGEFSPLYLESESVPKRIAHICPKVRLIVCVRDPIERIRSSIDHFSAKRSEFGVWTLDDVISDYPPILEQSRYATHLARFREALPDAPLLVLQYEQIARDPHAFLQELYRFLGIDESVVVPSERSRLNTSATRHAGWYKPLLRRYYALRRHPVGRRALAGLRALGVRGTLIERLPRRGYKKRTFTDDEYRFLLAHLRPEAEALARDGLIDPTLWPTLSS